MKKYAILVKRFGNGEFLVTTGEAKKDFTFDELKITAPVRMRADIKPELASDAIRTIATLLYLNIDQYPSVIVTQGLDIRNDILLNGIDGENIIVCSTDEDANFGDLINIACDAAFPEDECDGECGPNVGITVITSDGESVRFAKPEECDILDRLSHLDSSEDIVARIKDLSAKGEISYTVLKFHGEMSALNIADATKVSQELLDKTMPSNGTLEEIFGIAA